MQVFVTSLEQGQEPGDDCHYGDGSVCQKELGKQRRSPKVEDPGIFHDIQICPGKCCKLLIPFDVVRTFRKQWLDRFLGILNPNDGKQTIQYEEP